MRNKKVLGLVIGGILVLVGATLSLTYAFLSVSKKQDLANVFTSGCLNITIENESNSISLTNTYPITDIEGLEDEGYTFTIRNTCNTSTNYMINLESLNQTTNTLDTEYIKTSLSSDTMDNLIQKLDSSMATTAYIENAYIAHNLYKGTINGNSTKTFNLKLWMDYDTTKEQGASKTYTSKINVIANPDIEVTSTPEIKTTLVDNNLEGTITGESSTAKYCISENNICTPNIDTTITDNKINIELDRSNNQIVCLNLNNGKTQCTKVEKLLPITIPDIIATLNAKDTTPDFSQVSTTDEGVYAVSDGMYGGTSYYWRGAVTNNYVMFADKCWRIIRINGDKTIRLIYDGATCHANGTYTTDSIAVTSQKYNSSNDRSEYVGWTYSTGSQRTTSGTASNAKTQTDSWFNTNITETDVEKIADGKYCNDRNTANGYSWSSEPSSTFYYAGYERLVTNKTPTLNCPSGDIYIIKVGLITVDEVAYAGGVWLTNNSNYYLYNGQSYWTMSPYNASNTPIASAFYVRSYGYFGNNYVNHYSGFGSTPPGVRPVINLKADIKFKGGTIGTLDNPYVVI